jgi:hypothetical protein
LRSYALKVGLEIYRFDADLSGEKFAKESATIFAAASAAESMERPPSSSTACATNGEHTFDEMLQALGRRRQIQVNLYACGPRDSP